MADGTGITGKAWRTTLFSLLGALALIATSCGGADSADGSVSASVRDAVSAQAGASTAGANAPAGGEEPALIATTVSGEQINFNSLAGQDVVLWFWAPW